MIIAIFLATFSLNIHANDCVDCTPELKPFGDIEKSIANLQATAVVNCVDELKQSAKNEYLENFSKLPKKSLMIKGIKLEGSAEELKYLGLMLTDKPMDSWSKAKSCSTVLCALTNVYNSEETAHRALNIAKRTGYIVSVGKDFNIEGRDAGQLFSLDEIKDIDLAYKNLPSTYKKLKSLDRLKRMPDGYGSPTAPNAAAYASPGFHSSYYTREGEITFLDGAFSSDKSWGPHVAVHELTHHSDFSRSSKSAYGVSEDPAFLKISGWKKVQSYEIDEKTKKKVSVLTWKHAKDKKFVRDYAASEPAEDLADTAGYYMYTPKKLKALDPEKYEYLKKNVFGGKEYNPEPDLDIPDEEILKICVSENKDFSFYGKSYSAPSISSNCLDKYMKDFKITDPKLCEFNQTQIKNYLFDRIQASLKNSNDSLEKCNDNFDNLKNSCMDEGNFTKSCPIEKCNLDASLKNKARDAGYTDRDKAAFNAIQKKMGKNNFLSTVLISGLSGKEKVSSDYSLYYQRAFLENSSKGILNSFDKENFKFDSKDESMKSLSTYLMMDKPTTEALKSFQETVLKKSTKSKEKNLDLIKTWASNQSLEETPLFDELAESLRKYGKGF